MKFHYFSLHFKVNNYKIIDIGYARTSKKLKVLCKKLGAKVEENSSSNNVPYFFIQEHMFEYKDEFNKDLAKQCIEIINHPEKEADPIGTVAKKKVKQQSIYKTPKKSSTQTTTKVTINGVDYSNRLDELDDIFAYHDILDTINQLRSNIKKNNVSRIGMDTDSVDEESDLEKFI